MSGTERRGPGGPAADSLDVVVVVVNFNAGAHLVDCVDSLVAAGAPDIIVVDNASTDDSRGLVVDRHPQVAWMDAGANLGYGRAANLGAARSGADVVVCNPDVVVAPDALRLLVAGLAADADLGIVGPLVHNSDGTIYPSARTFPDLVDAMGHGLLGLVTPHNPFTRRYRLLDWDHHDARRVDWVSGACMLVRRQAWDAIGGFDPSYFMYLEDVDLCWRAQRAGWDVIYEPAAEVTHAQGISTRLRPYRMLAIHHWSMWRFAWRSTVGGRRALLPVVGVGLIARLGVAGLRHRAGGQKAEVPARSEPDH
ncbi:MAG: glycosyltransferase family 2 protein [Actinomycetota bacterium]|nr:glycosyltransferase family 2 protein [Actinomycetota bacterium]